MQVSKIISVSVENVHNSVPRSVQEKLDNMYLTLFRLQVKRLKKKVKDKEKQNDKLDEQIMEMTVTVAERELIQMSTGQLLGYLTISFKSVYST